MGGGNPNQPTQLFQTRVNQSVYGLPYPVVMGTAQVQQNILWLDGFVATQQQASGKGGSGGGKGGGGKSGGTFYTYTVNCVSAICNGPITAIADVWSGQSWLGSPTAAETYTIAGGGVYTPTNAAGLKNNLGVGVQNAYSASYNDYGSPGSVTLSGTDLSPMTQVAYGTTLTTGLYSVDPATGNYHFNNTTDAGRTVQLSYSYSLTSINQQENDLIPAGKTITVTLTGGATFATDEGVRDTTTSAAFTRVSGSPTLAATYQVTGSGAGPIHYNFSTPDIAREVTITYSITDPNAVGQDQPTQLNYTLAAGNPGQSPYAFLTASYPGAAFGFTNLATLLYQPMGLGSSAEIQQNRFEVITADAYGGGIQDCNPITCINQVLLNGQWGLGVGPVPFPTSVLDNGVGGTWGGAPTTPGGRQVSSQAWNWFAANSFFISPVIDSQDTAASIVSKWIEAGMCAAFMSEGLLKLVPYGDTTTAANGVTWTAPQNFIVALDDTTFVSKEGEDPVKSSSVSAADAWNAVQIQWTNRFNQYSPEVTQESDQGLMNRWGERREDPQNWDFIHTVQAATFAANMRLKHGCYDRGTYEFTLPFTYSYLEPMDIVTISTTSVWAAGLNNVNLGVTNWPVRIIKIVDDPKIGLQITAEDYPFGAHQPTLYNKQISNGDVVANAFADPGTSEIVMFEATNRLTQFDGDQIWIGACGTSKNYGWTNIWVSQTPYTVYEQIGSIRSAARMGVLHSTFATGSDPDTTHTLVVDLVENCQALEAGTTTDADNNTTLCFVDGEYLSYSALSVTGQDQITMGLQGSPPSGYLRRGQMGSTISAHSAGTLFMRLDGSIFKYTYDPTWRGQTLKFKFQAVNAFGNNPQPLSNLTPVSFTLPGTNPGTVDASTGLIIDGGTGYSIASLTTLAPYNGSTAYTVGMEVTYNGNTYKCILNTTGHVPTNTTYWAAVTAIYNFTGVCASGGSSTWYKVGTLVFGSDAESANFQFLSGSGYNTTTNQQTNTQITMRTGNNSAAPNLSGITWSENGGSSYTNAAVLNVKAVATGGSTSVSNLSWDLYMEVAAFSSGTLIVNIGQDCSFTLINTTTTDPGAGSSTVVVGIGGFGQGGIVDGSSNFSATASTLTYRPTTNPLTGHDAGSNATINIASFSMLTSSKGTVAENSGSITGLSYKSLYYVYFDDASLAGGAVTYHATATKTTAINGAGRFFVGSIVTPAATAPDTIGNNDGGVGAQAGGTNVFLFGAQVNVNGGTGTSTITNPNNAFDGDLTTACVMNMQSVASGGLSGTINNTLTLSLASPTAGAWSSLTLYVVTSITGVANLGHCEGKVDYSLDGGNSYTNIFDTVNANRALTADAVALPVAQNISLVRVRFTQDSLSFTNHADQNFNCYEAYVVGVI